MILSKTPLRISFAGGGADYFNNFSKTKGRVIATTIDKYLYLSVNQKHDKKIRISYSITENVNNINQINNQLIKECIKFYNIKNSIEVVTVADVPSSGSGLASSSALVVGLVNALRCYKNLKSTKEILARTACIIEREKCRKPIGMQDQYLTAYGGLNRLEFFNNNVKVTKINLTKERLFNFKKNLLLFYTGISRKADKILGLIKKSGKQFENYEKLSRLAEYFEYELIKGNLINCGEILHENWMLKKNLNKSVSSLNLDSIYNKAIECGAKGGKILGAGGGGYFLFFVEPKHQKNLVKHLKPLQLINFDFSDHGSQLFKF
jgi:D-glycero-alpha-D-manno-heptose-7-phosphate kinase